MARKHLDRYSQVKFSIAFYSAKNRRHQYCESHAEVGALLELEFDPEVACYQTQPESFRYYTCDGRARRYTPDTLVRSIQGTYWYEEVKTQSSADKPEFQRKLQYLQWLFENQMGVPLRLRIAKAPHQCPRSANLNRLYRYCSRPISQAAIQLLRIIPLPLTLADVVAEFQKARLGVEQLYAAMAQQLIRFDLSQEIGDLTVLEAAHV